ncbi:MAG TPA: hypothetical protein VFW90_00420 [Candidatus Saccharimonadales bacterium]|nr:hypothetical protein [Candidatus Saccharimonadales bacterium]
MDPAQAKQQIAERVKQATKFLVTVNSNPTVDQLAACIGLTLLLNKMGKHATAVFSGKVPNTIEFLQPDKTLQSNTDSLQDFIISLDKNKADKLRYKVEDQFVRIFITPYRTSLNEKDLVFSQGDFNVEVVMALGINNRTQIDAAITAHGRILHDATVISLNAGPGKSPDVGQINWQDETASSLSEMLVSISEAFGPGLIDSQMATAFLTGIVAETERFSNNKTSPKVMTMSAQLMAAGANQQLIASKLAPPPPPPPPPKQPPPKPPKPPAPPPKKPNPPKPKQPPLKPEGVIDVPHGPKNEENTQVDLGTTEIHIDEQGNLKTYEEVAQPPGSPEPSGDQPPPVSAPQPIPQQPAEPPREPAQPPPPPQPPTYPAPQPGAPAVSGHSYLNPQTAGPKGQPDWATPYDLVPMDPFSQSSRPSEDLPSGRPSSAPSTPNVDTSIDEIGVARPQTAQVTPVSAPLDDARNAVQQAFASEPFDPAFNGPVQSLNSQQLDSEPLHPQQTGPMPTPPLPSIPPVQMTNSDTPMLVLPTGAPAPPPPMPAQAPVNSQPGLASLPPATAPPPVPPPLMTAPGAVVPHLNDQQPR